MKCWGNNGHGLLGLGDIQTRWEPEHMRTLPIIDLGPDRTAKTVAAGYVSTCAILDDGTLKCWGNNALGEIGIGQNTAIGDEPGEMGDDLPVVDLGTNKNATKIAIGGHHACAILDDGTVKCWGYNDCGQLGLGDFENRGDEPGEMGDNLPAVDLGQGKSAKDVAAGWEHSCAILDDDTLKCWGCSILGGFGVKRGDEPGEMGDALPIVELY